MIINNNTRDFDSLPLVQVSQTQEDRTMLDAILLQRRIRSSLQELLKSHAEGNAPRKTALTKPPTLPSTQVLQPDPANKKRKRDSKGKEVKENATFPKRLRPIRGPKQPTRDP